MKTEKTHNQPHSRRNSPCTAALACADHTRLPGRAYFTNWGGRRHLGESDTSIVPQTWRRGHFYPRTEA